MTLNEFWQTIDGAREANRKLVDVPPYLVNTLSRLNERDIIDYGSHFRDCMHRSYDAKLWLAAVVLLGGCGDDKFADFRSWLVAQERDAFDSALLNPDSIADLERFDGDYGYPILFYLGSVAQRAFCKRVAEDPDDFEAGMRFESLFPVRKYPPLENEQLVNTSENDAKALLPRLAARFGNGMRV